MTWLRSTTRRGPCDLPRSADATATYLDDVIDLGQRGIPVEVFLDRDGPRGTAVLLHTGLLAAGIAFAIVPDGGAQAQ